MKSLTLLPSEKSKQLFDEQKILDIANFQL